MYTSDPLTAIPSAIVCEGDDPLVRAVRTPFFQTQAIVWLFGDWPANVPTKYISASDDQIADCTLSDLVLVGGDGFGAELFEQAVIANETIRKI